jgi:Zn-dependent protease
MVWVAAAGPASNLAMAILWAVFFSVQRAIGLDEQFFQAMAFAGIQVNLVLMALNLLPVPPLDGGRIMVGLLPHRMSYQFARLEPYGLIIVILLLATGTLGVFLSPFLQLGKAIVGMFV